METLNHGILRFNDECTLKIDFDQETDDMTATRINDVTGEETVITGGGHGGGIKYQIGTVTFDADTAAHLTQTISHNLGEIPAIIIVWTEDFNNLSDDNPNPYATTTMVGGCWVREMIAIPQTVSSSASVEAAQTVWSIGSNSIKLSYNLSSASYGFHNATASTFELPKLSSTSWWRTGITYKFLVIGKFW